MNWFGNIPNHPPPPASGPHPPPPPPPFGAPPFWDFINSFGPNNNRGAGYGVDHAAGPHGFTFGPQGFDAWTGHRGFGGHWGGRGRGGRGGWGGRGPSRHWHYSDDEPSSGEEMPDATAEAAAQGGGERDPEKADSPATMRSAADGEHPDPPEEVPTAPHRHCHGRHGRRGSPGGRGRGRGHHGHGPHGRYGGRHGGGPGGPPPFGPFGSFDFNGMFNAFADHPFARGLREHVGNPWVAATQQQERSPAAAANPQQEKEDDDNDETFVPPIDIFNTSNSWTLHVAIPGAKKEDVDVNFDADRSTLTVSGLVYRPGDEAFLRGLISGERMVGLFERKVQLPPPTTAAVQAGAHEQEKEEVDADNITAKMEDGILIVVVPKLEKEWTEVKKVDIE